MIVCSEGRTFQADATDCCHVECASKSSTAALRKHRFAFPLAALLHLNVKSCVGHYLVPAVKPVHIPKFRAQDRDGLRSKFGYAAQPLGRGISDEKFVDLL